jgi:DNA-binding response OmpR family regulator
MRNILVVDDEPEIVQFIGTALEDEGFDVTTAGDGRRAVDLANEQAPDLIVLDAMLPRLDGQGVAAEVRRVHGDIPILLITADGRAPEKAIAVGAFAYLSKPFELDTLLALIHRRLES